MGGFWNRLFGRGEDAAAKRDADEAGMSPAERKFAHESVEDHQADVLVEEHLGGIDTNRLLDSDDAPPS
jgi:hypothetical protein